MYIIFEYENIFLFCGIEFYQRFWEKIQIHQICWGTCRNISAAFSVVRSQCKIIQYIDSVLSTSNANVLFQLCLVGSYSFIFFLPSIFLLWSKKDLKTLVKEWCGSVSQVFCAGISESKPFWFRFWMLTPNKTWSFLVYIQLIETW